MGRRAGVKKQGNRLKMSMLAPTEVGNFCKIPCDLVKSIVRRAMPQNLKNNLIPSTGNMSRAK